LISNGIPHGRKQKSKMRLKEQHPGKEVLENEEKQIISGRCLVSIKDWTTKTPNNRSRAKTICNWVQIQLERHGYTQSIAHWQR
jgi:hypothetical protein